MIAAVEQFLRDTLPPAAPPEPAPEPWLRAARMEGVGREPDAPPVVSQSRSSATTPCSRPSRRGTRSSTSATAFAAHHAGEWTMPAKVYLQAPPHGDFRAMPALGGGFAMLKWISSFPGNPAGARAADGDGRRLPVGRGDERAADAARRARGDRAAHRRGRGGRRAGARARRARRAVGVIGCGLHGAWAARCLAAAGYGPGVCADPRPEAAEALAAELGWRAGERAEALGVRRRLLRHARATSRWSTSATCGPGLHLNMLGADGPGKAEATVEAVARCALFCDEWAQASHGGELTGAVEAGAVTRDRGHRPRRGARRRGARARRTPTR